MKREIYVCLELFTVTFSGADFCARDLPTFAAQKDMEYICIKITKFINICIYIYRFLFLYISIGIQMYIYI